jgi:Family of unknown function (DUF6496)
MAKTSAAYRQKVRDVMSEFKRGTLRIGRSKKMVTNRRQAVAIALSEARRKFGKLETPTFSEVLKKFDDPTSGLAKNFAARAARGYFGGAAKIGGAVGSAVGGLRGGIVGRLRGMSDVRRFGFAPPGSGGRYSEMQNAFDSMRQARRGYPQWAARQGAKYGRLSGRSTGEGAGMVGALTLPLAAGTTGLQMYRDRFGREGR